MPKCGRKTKPCTKGFGMAHREQREFIEDVKNRFPSFFSNKKVLEVGSLNINGSVRDFFNDCCYIGVDLDIGPGVDLVASGESLKFRNDFFDTVISCECFEHNPYWGDTFKNMIRMSSGIVIMTCATEGRPEHGTTRTSVGESPFTATWNYYQNLTESDFSFVDFSIFKKYEFSVNTKSHDLYFWGIKNV